MSIFSRGSKKRKNFVGNKMQETNATYTDKEANEEYMKQKEKWAADIIKGLKKYCTMLCDLKALWEKEKNSKDGSNVLWDEQGNPHNAINQVMRSEVYKNVNDGGSSSKYLQQVQFELGKLLATNQSIYTDPANFKSSMQSCGKGLSKLKHPIGSTALVKVGEKGERIVDYVDELARLMLNKTVQENAAILVTLANGAEWPANNENYKYQTMTTKYVTL